MPFVFVIPQIPKQRLPIYLHLPTYSVGSPDTKTQVKQKAVLGCDMRGPFQVSQHFRVSQQNGRSQQRRTFSSIPPVSGNSKRQPEYFIYHTSNGTFPFCGDCQLTHQMHKRDQPNVPNFVYCFGKVLMCPPLECSGKLFYCKFMLYRDRVGKMLFTVVICIMVHKSRLVYRTLCVTKYNPKPDWLLRGEASKKLNSLKFW